LYSFTENTSSYTSLNSAQITKLKQLTIATLSGRNRVKIFFNMFLKEKDLLFLLLLMGFQLKLPFFYLFFFLFFSFILILELTL